MTDTTPHRAKVKQREQGRGRGLFIEADCLEDAKARACLMARGDEAIESVRQFARA